MVYVIDRREIAHAFEQTSRHARRRYVLAISRAPSSAHADENARAALDNGSQFIDFAEGSGPECRSGRERRGQEPGARAPTSVSLGKLDLHRTRGRPLANDEIELESLIAG